jgi:hypothetical protein
VLKGWENWLESANENREDLVNHFIRHVSSLIKVRPMLDCVVFPTLSSEMENLDLTTHFSLSGIAAWSWSETETTTKIRVETVSILFM